MLTVLYADEIEISLRQARDVLQRVDLVALEVVPVLGHLDRVEPLIDTLLLLQRLLMVRRFLTRAIGLGAHELADGVISVVVCGLLAGDSVQRNMNATTDARNSR